MRAPVLDGEDPIVHGAEHRDPPARRRHATCPPAWDIINATDLDPAHDLSLRRLHQADSGHWPELVSVLAGDPFRPRIDLGEVLREDEAVEKGLALVLIVEDLAA